MGKDRESEDVEMALLLQQMSQSQRADFTDPVLDDQGLPAPLRAKLTAVQAGLHEKREE